MILTCPECATSYFVEDDRVPPRGRSVKCSSCGARWRALPDGEPELEIAPPPPAPPIAQPGDNGLGAVDDDILFVPSSAKAKAGRKAAPKGRSPLLAVGVAVLAILALAAGAAVVLRQQIADRVPASARLFAAIGLPVNSLGLVIEDVVWKPAFLAGRPVLAVTGSIRNLRKQTIVAPAVRIGLLDKAQQPLTTYRLAVQNGRVPPGGRRYFAWNLPDPPAGAHHLDIGFDLAAALRPPAASTSPPSGAPPTPAPVEAKPLSPDSPDALAKHE